MVLRRRRTTMVGVLALLTLVLAGWQAFGVSTIQESVDNTDTDTTSTTTVLSGEVEGAATPEYAVTVLATLPVKGRAPNTGYAREQFDAGWAQVDDCDMRQYVLARDMTDVVFDTDGCTVLSGLLADPYTGTTIAFARGTRTSSAVQIDHVVALSNAWQTGARQLDVSVRAEFANDPLNLLAVDGPTNQQKGAADAASWLPPNSAYRCRYVARQIAVKQKYDLWVTTAEQAAMQRQLQRCPDQRLPLVEAQ